MKAHSSNDSTDHEKEIYSERPRKYSYEEEARHLGSFACFCRKVMEKQGLTTVALAEKSGIARAQISHYLNDMYAPTLKNQLKITEALGVDYDAIMKSNIPLSLAMNEDPQLKDFILKLFDCYKILSDHGAHIQVLERADELVKLVEYYQLIEEEYPYIESRIPD